jgi:hypothetical protein
MKKIETLKEAAEKLHHMLRVKKRLRGRKVVLLKVFNGNRKKL